jgi:hypothetical protein
MFSKEPVRFTLSATVATVLVLTASLSLLAAAPAAAQTPPTNCQDALDASGGGNLLVHDTTLSKEKTVDEWDSDILKFTAPRPGLLDVSAVGASSQSSLYTGSPSASTYQFVNGAPAGTNHRVSTTIVAGKVYCIEVDPAAGGTGNVRLDVKFVDTCKTGQPDDHGDSFACATAIDPLSSTTAGAITASDHDLFAFDLSASTTVEIESTGDTDTAGKLYDEDGALLASDSDSGLSLNFRIVQTLGAGRYYLRVQSENGDSGNYSLVAQ